MQKIDSEIIYSLKGIVGPNNYIDDAKKIDPYVKDIWGQYNGTTPLVLRPISTDMVSEIVTLCNNNNIGIVPQGGNTGLVGGGVPSDSGMEILISMDKMNAVCDIDAVNYTMTVEAGCILSEVQDAAFSANRLFPLSLGAEGSCQIGGNLSTNAGGTAVLRYGNAKELVLGLEVVLPNGTIYDGLRRLRKDNTGYDLKQLFLGSEGTLGIITKAVLKLFPLPEDKVTSLVALSSLEAAPRLLSSLREITGDNITAFEYMDRACLDILETHTDLSDPFSEKYSHFALVELTSSRVDANLYDLLERTFKTTIDDGSVVDAVVASSESQATQLWKMREMLPEVYRLEGGGLTFDISVPVSSVPEFINRSTKLCNQSYDKGVVLTFGHIGDGNVHFIFMKPRDVNMDDFLSETKNISNIMYDTAAEFNGSFSAEHGVGVYKKNELEIYKSKVELSLMKTLKRSIDVNNIMNPNKVV
ncbi:MAG TPA: FAD-binding oxidoreductase [Candidatus Thioglobus sp.]|nr:FAD-binding oxidoreductase [Candidatus Thioglobus sp.]